jgi:hypothetical protein
VVGQPAVIAPDILSLRPSSVATLAAHGAIDASQVAAAFRVRNAFEVTVEAKRESIGFAEWQAPGPPPPELAEIRAGAAKDLKQARGLLGAHGYALIGRVVGEGYHLADLFAQRREREVMTFMLKLHLTSLARLWQR